MERDRAEHRRYRLCAPYIRVAAHFGLNTDAIGDVYGSAYECLHGETDAATMLSNIDREFGLTGEGL